MLRAGELREKITWEDQTRTSDGAGGGSYAPTTVLSSYAAVDEVQSKLSDVASKDDVKQLVT